jgi:hypothetical protein
VTWHSGGLQAIRIDRGLRQAGWFSPHPLDAVANEDPALSAGPNKVVMWSFPIIRDGLIYVIDIRNGLYVLRYNVERQREVRRISFLDGHLEPHRRASPTPAARTTAERHAAPAPEHLARARATGSVIVAAPGLPALEG